MGISNATSSIIWAYQRRYNVGDVLGQERHIDDSKHSAVISIVLSWTVSEMAATILSSTISYGISRCEYGNPQLLVPHDSWP
eukprot:scaffold529_cov109-Skeletonema_marinoi.AAC.2